MSLILLMDARCFFKYFNPNQLVVSKNGSVRPKGQSWDSSRFKPTGDRTTFVN